MVKLVIFDMDGVLVDACEWHRVSLNKALKEVCNYEISLEEHLREYNGIPTKVKLHKLIDKGILDISLVDKIESLKQEKTIESIKKLAYIRKEKIDLMKYLKEKNVKICCYTNSIRKTSELMLKKTGILKYFELLITNQDVKKPKPDPEGYLLAMNRLNISPNNTIIVEDSEKGIQAAKSSGAFVIEVKNQEFVDINLLKDYIK